MQTLVSIIVPVYNHEQFIAYTIKSVISQTYQNWELLIVDDCSVDNSWSIIQTYTKKDSRIKVFKNKTNKGLIPNWKFLIDRSKGDYISFLEGDDYFRKDYLWQKMMVFNKYHNVKMVYSDMNVVDEKNKIIFSRYYKINRIKTFQNEMVGKEKFLFSRIGLLASYSQIMLKKNIIDKVGYPRSFNKKAKVFLPSDWDFNFRISTQNKIFYIDSPLVSYRKHGNNSSANIPLVGRQLSLILNHYAKQNKKNTRVLEGIEYQRAGILYYRTLYFLENDNKKRALLIGKKYFSQYKKFFIRDAWLNIKLLIRLMLPNFCNKLIQEWYYKK